MSAQVSVGHAHMQREGGGGEERERERGREGEREREREGRSASTAGAASRLDWGGGGVRGVLPAHQRQDLGRLRARLQVPHTPDIKPKLMLMGVFGPVYRRPENSCLALNTSIVSRVRIFHGPARLRARLQVP